MSLQSRYGLGTPPPAADDREALGFQPEPGPEVPDPWRHRSREMRCWSCMFWVEKPDPGPSDPMSPIMLRLGRCRRHAPAIGGFPVVYEDDWCGDHRLRGSVR